MRSEAERCEATRVATLTLRVFASLTLIICKHLSCTVVDDGVDYTQTKKLVNHLFYETFVTIGTQ